MIAYIKGAITLKNPAYLYVETGGLGYHVNISLATYSKIEKLEQVKLLTHLNVKEDSHTLFGFFDQAERSLFVHLISVSGVGPTTAMVVLSSMTSEQIRQAILMEDEVAFKKVKGIGAKTAKQIILDLKSKVAKEGGSELSPGAMRNTAQEEALSALLALGFNRNKVLQILQQLGRKQPEIDNVESLVKAALTQLSS
ncbi:MAG: Holliday junction branch migration protein RuvA [Saprospiraceae bacterium]|nr:Holliday junction branch migration protein RuvA [Saprospiraceae bacterium]